MTVLLDFLYSFKVFVANRNKISTSIFLILFFYSVLNQPFTFVHDDNAVFSFSSLDRF